MAYTAPAVEYVQPSYAAPMAYTAPAIDYAQPSLSTSFVQVPMGEPVWVPDAPLTSAPSMLAYPPTTPTPPTAPATTAATKPAAKPAAKTTGKKSTKKKAKKGCC